MVDASVGMVRIQNNSNSTDAILASYRFDSCPDYMEYQSQMLGNQCPMSPSNLMTAWKDKQI